MNIIQFAKRQVKSLVNILKADVFQLLPLQEVRDWYVINSEWNVIAFLTLNWFDKSLASDQELNAVLVKHLDLLNTRISWPICYSLIKNKSDLSDYRHSFDDFVNSSTSISSNSKKIINIFNWVNTINMSNNYDIPEKKYLISVSYKVRLSNALNLTWSINYKLFNYISAKQWQKIKAVLDDEVYKITSIMNSWWVNLWARKMTEREIVNYFKEQLDWWVNWNFRKKWKYLL